MHIYFLCDAEHDACLGLFAYSHTTARNHDRSCLLQHRDIIQCTLTQTTSHASESLASSYQSRSVTAQCINNDHLSLATSLSILYRQLRRSSAALYYRYCQKTTYLRATASIRVKPNFNHKGRVLYTVPCHGQMTTEAS